MFAVPTSAEWSVVWLSLQVATAAMIFTLPLGFGAAWLLARRDFPGKAIFEAAITLPLVLPPVVVGYGLLLVFGRNGALGDALAAIGIVLPFTWGGAVLAAGIMGFPLMVRAMRLSLEAVPRELEDAAASIGAPPLKRLLTITLPLALPGLLAGAILSFARALGEFGATITFAGNIPGVTRTIPTAIYTLMQQPGGDVAVLRLTIFSVLIAFAALLAGEALARRVRAAHG